MYSIKQFYTFILLVLFSLSAVGGSVTLAWDASPTPGCTYTLYGSTNTVFPTNTSTAQLRVNCSTNLAVLVTDIAPAGTWRFAVTAQQGGIESDLSNILVLQVPTAPGNMRTVALQYSATLVGTNFLDALFLKLRIVP